MIGAMSSIFLSFNGGGPRFCVGVVDVNNTMELLLMPSIRRFPLPVNENV